VVNVDFVASIHCDDKKQDYCYPYDGGSEKDGRVDESKDPRARFGSLPIGAEIARCAEYYHEATAREEGFSPK